MSYFATQPGPGPIPGTLQPNDGQIALKRCSFCHSEIPPSATYYEVRSVARGLVVLEAWVFDKLICLDAFVWTELLKGNR